MHHFRPNIPSGSLSNRSKITNGSRLLAGVDGRSPDARRFRDLMNGYAAELGGIENLSLFDRTSVRNCAGMTLRLEQLQSAVANNDATVSTDELIRLSGAVKRILESLMQRRFHSLEPKRPTLSDYLRGKPE